MTTKKGNTYYYITKKVIIKLEALKDYEGHTTLPFKIVAYIKGRTSDAGLEILQPGKHITSNQLRYVAANGADKLIAEEGMESIKKVFENEIF